VRDQLQTREVETFLATVERWSRWKDRRKKVAFPLFPGYCFVRFSLVDRLRVLNVAGVADLVGVAGRPEPVPDAEIEAIQRSRARRSVRPAPIPDGRHGRRSGARPAHRGSRQAAPKGPVSRLVLAVTLIRQAAVVEIHPPTSSTSGAPSCEAGPPAWRAATLAG